jgi:thiol-disulfide isomerase/thioredoxin
MKQFLLAASAAMLLAGCNNYVIKGNLPELDKPYVYLCTYEPGDLEILDSAKVENGIFTLKGKAEQAQVAYLSVDKVQPFCRFFLEKGDMQVEGSYLNSEVFVSGTAKNDDLNELNTLIYDTRERWLVTELESDKKQLEEHFIEQLRQLIAKNRDNICGMVILAEVAPAFLTQEELLEELDAFSEEWQQRPELNDLRTTAEREIAVRVGKTYTDIKATSNHNEEVALSDVLNKEHVRYVLLDFWASWCGPCMHEVPFLKEAYATYRDKGFEIYGVSLDDDKNRWQETVDKEQMPWTQVCDGEGFYGITELYAVESIPANFLIRASDGQIVASQLRGEELLKQLGELLAE